MNIKYTTTTDFYYNNPTVVSFMTFCFSWMGIIAYFAFYFSVFTSIVYLSNKNLFDIVDELKSSAGSDSESKGFMNNIKVAVEGFKSGGSSQALTGGFDNIIVFILILAPNFKKYSMYSNVEGDDDGKTKLSKDDTVGSYILKISISSIIFMTIISMMMSSRLFLIFANLGDVLQAKVGILASEQVNIKLANWLNVSGMYEFSYNNSGQPSDEIANSMANQILTTVLKDLDNVTDDQVFAIGKSIEDGMNGTTVITVSEIPSFYVNGDTTDLSNVTALINKTRADQLTVAQVADPLVLQNVKVRTPTTNSNPSDLQGQQLVFSVAKILENAGLSTMTQKEQYIHFSLTYGASNTSSTVTETDTTGEETIQ